MKVKQIFTSKVSALILMSAVTLTGCSITDVTSTTSGSLDTVTPDVSLNRFVDIRMASIQKEAAQGAGENLDALAELMDKKDKPAFSSWMHENHDALFTNLEKPSQLVSRINHQTRIENQMNSLI